MDVNQANPQHVLIAGGGLVGMSLAFRLQKLLRRELKRGEVKITVVDPNTLMTYQSFLPEAAAGSLEPRHVVVPLRRVLPRVNVVTGSVVGIDHANRKVSVEPHSGTAYDLSYDQLVVGFGSVTRVLPIPGLPEVGIGFKTVEEAIWLRNRVLERLDVAASTQDEVLRKRALSFVFIGGGYTGIEALAELEDMARDVCKSYYKNSIGAGQMRWVLVEATGRILPEVGEDLGKYAVKQLRERGIDVKLETQLKSTVDGHVVLSDGTEFDADTVVWTAGVKANPVLAESDLPLDEKGRLRCLTTLRVDGVEDAWGAGDTAAVPDLTGAPGAICGPSAQHAVRQAKTLASNIVRALRGSELKEYRHKYLGSVASLGLHKGVAQIYGVKLRGWPAWFMHRSYHVGKMPTFNRKVRIVLDWSLALFFRREVVSLGSFHRPREAWERSAQPRRTAVLAGESAGQPEPARTK
jgi:NADH dehydrogenase